MRVRQYSTYSAYGYIVCTVVSQCPSFYDVGCFQALKECYYPFWIIIILLMFRKRIIRLCVFSAYIRWIIVAAPGYYNEFLFWRETNVIQRYLRRTTFVPLKFFWRILRGRGGLLSFGVNLRVLGLLSVHAFVSFRAKVHTDNFIEWIH